MTLINRERRTTERHRTHLRRITRFAVKLAMTIVAGLVVTAAPAQAAIPDTLQNTHTQRCLADFFSGGPTTVACVTGGVGQFWW